MNKVEWANKHWNPSPCCGHSGCFGMVRSFEHSFNKRGEPIGKCFSCGHYASADDDSFKAPFDFTKEKDDTPPPPAYLTETALSGERCKLFGIFALNIGENAATGLFDAYSVKSLTHYGRTYTAFCYHDGVGLRGVKCVFYDGLSRHKEVNIFAPYKVPQAYYCLYGEHLIGTQDYKSVLIVESEKTALVASHYLPGVLVLATGGASFSLAKSFTPRVLEFMQGKQVELAFDNDKAGKECTTRTLKHLLSKGIKARVFGVRFDAKGGDLADYYFELHQWVTVPKVDVNILPEIQETQAPIEEFVPVQKAVQPMPILPSIPHYDVEVELICALEDVPF